MYKNTNVCQVIEKYCSLYRVNGGCAYPGGICLEIVEQCADCPNIINNRCKIYPNPSMKWKSRSGCPRRRRKLSNFERKRFFKRNPRKS